MLVEHRVIKLTGENGTAQSKIADTCDEQYLQGFELVTAFQSGSAREQELGGLGGSYTVDAPITLVFRKVAGRVEKLGLLG